MHGRKPRKITRRRLVTFGSQPAFFHSIHPRASLEPFEPPGHVSLPASIGQWVNLWEPLDPLAFIVARVFKLASGGAPQDEPVPHRFRDGLYTHSSYWDSSEVAEIIREVLETRG